MNKFFKRSALGAQVPHNKGTAGQQTKVMPLPSKIVLSMGQHIGAPAAPVVAKGDQVYVGSVVGKAAGFVSMDIHSGVSGIVDSITTITAPNGAPQTAVVIIPDGNQTVDPEIKPPVVTDLASLQNAVRASGLLVWVVRASLRRSSWPRRIWTRSTLWSSMAPSASPT